MNVLDHKWRIDFKTIVLFLFFVVTGSIMNTNAQTETALVRTYGGEYFEEGRQIIECAGGGYAIVGTTGSDEVNNTNFYLVRIDEQLDCVWSKSIGGPATEWGYSLVENDNHELILCGYTNSNLNSGYDILVYKVNESGNVIWQKTFGGSDWDFAYKIIAHPNGGYLIAGKTFSFGNGGSDGYLLHIDEDGTLISEATFGGQGDDGFVDVTSGGSNVFVAGTEQLMNGNFVGSVRSLDLAGQISWEYFSLTEDSNHGIESIVFANDRIVIVGNREVGEYEIGYLESIDLSGNQLLWMIPNEIGDFAYNGLEYANEELYILGNTNMYGSGEFDGLIHKRETSGFYLGGRTFGYAYTDRFNDALVREDFTIFLGRTRGVSTEVGSDQMMTIYYQGNFSGGNVLSAPEEINCFSVSVAENLIEDKIVLQRYYSLFGSLIGERKNGFDTLLNFDYPFILHTFYEHGEVSVQKLFHLPTK